MFSSVSPLHLSSCRCSCAIPCFCLFCFCCFFLHLRHSAHALSPRCPSPNRCRMAPPVTVYHLRQRRVLYPCTSPPPLATPSKASKVKLRVTARFYARRLRQRRRHSVHQRSQVSMAHNSKRGRAVQCLIQNHKLLCSISTWTISSTQISRQFFPLSKGKARDKRQTCKVSRVLSQRYR